MRRDRRQIDFSAQCAKCGYQAATLSVAFCPGCGCTFVPASTGRTKRRLTWLSIPQMLYQTAYKWFVLISAFDVVLTWFILLMGGQEVNPVADAVIMFGGLQGIVIYKFCLVMWVVLICEIVGRRKPRVGRNLVRTAIAITSLPVVLSVVELLK